MRFLKLFYQRSKHVKIKIYFFSAITTECYDCTSKTLFYKENIEIEKSLYGVCTQGLYAGFVRKVSQHRDETLITIKDIDVDYSEV